MDDTDAYLNLAITLWEEEQAGGYYLWDINLLPLPKEELKGAIEVFMWDFKRRNPRLAIASGVLARAYNFFVALFTLISVACAERITETSSSKFDEYLSSVVGVGFSSRRRARI